RQRGWKRMYRERRVQTWGVVRGTWCVTLKTHYAPRKGSFGCEICSFNRDSARLILVAVNGDSDVEPLLEQGDVGQGVQGKPVGGEVGRALCQRHRNQELIGKVGVYRGRTRHKLPYLSHCHIRHFVGGQ